MSQRKEKYARRMEREIDGLKQRINSVQATMELDRKICADDAYRKELTEAEDRERRMRTYRRLRKIEQSIARQLVVLLIAIVLSILALSIVFIMVFNMGQAGAEQAREAETSSAGYTETVPTAAECDEYEVDAWAGE